MRAASDPIWRRTGSSCQSYGTGSAGDRWRLSTVWYQQPKVKMGWQRLERSHLFKKQKQNPQRTNKTKNKTALSRIWRHNREVHHPHPLTLPWKLTVHRLWALASVTSHNGNQSTTAFTQGKAKAGHLLMRKQDTQALHQRVPSGIQASLCLWTRGNFWSGRGCTDKGKMTLSPTYYQKAAASPTQTTAHGQI